MHHLVKSVVAEFLGTFILVFIGCGALIWSMRTLSTPLPAAVAFGTAFIAAFYAFAIYSGAHCNPVFTLAAAGVGRCISWLQVILYIIAQFAGAIVAACILWLLFAYDTDNSYVGYSTGLFTESGQYLKAVCLEIVLTAILVFTFLVVTRNPQLSLLSGIILGVVFAGLVLVGLPYSGGSMNPARSFGPAIFSTADLKTYWIYLVGPIVGMILAVMVYMLFRVKCESNFAEHEEN